MQPSSQPGAKSSSVFRWALFLLIASALAACAAPPSPAPTAPAVTSSPTPTPAPSLTPTPAFTPTPSATPILPVINGTPYPQPLEPIRADNLTRLRPLALLSPGDGPRDIDLSADESLFAVLFAGGVQLYDPQTLQQTSFFAADSPSSSLQAVVLSSDGGLLAAGDTSGSIEVWDVAAHQLVLTIPDAHRGPIWSLALSPDGKTLVSGGYDRKARLWDLSTGEPAESIQHGGSVTQVKFSPDGQRVFSGSDDTTIKVTELATGRTLNTFFDSGSVRAVALSPDGKFLASDNSIWDLSSGEKLYSLRVQFANAVEFLDGGRLAVADSDTIMILDVQSGDELRRFDSNASSLAFLPEQDLLLAGSSQEGTLQAWDLVRGRLAQEWELGQTSLLSVAFSPDGSQAAAGMQYDVAARTWDTRTGTLLQTFSEDYRGSNCDGVDDLAFSFDGSQLITAASCNFNMLRAWNTQTGKPLRVLDKEGANHVAFSPDGRLLAWSGYKKVVLWDAVAGGVLRSWNPRPSGTYYDLEFSPDGRLLAVFSTQSGNLQLWDVESGELVNTLGDYSEGIWTAAFSPDSRLIAVGTSDRAQLWDIESGASVQVLKMPGEYVFELAFSPSNELLVTSGGEPTNNIYTRFWQLRFWQVSDGQLLHTQPVGIRHRALAFSPDGLLLLAGTQQDGTLRLWGIPGP